MLSKEKKILINLFFFIGQTFQCPSFIGCTENPPRCDFEMSGSQAASGQVCHFKTFQGGRKRFLVFVGISEEQAKSTS
jgi:hypothetical protein